MARRETLEQLFCPVIETHILIIQALMPHAMPMAHAVNDRTIIAAYKTRLLVKRKTLKSPESDTTTVWEQSRQTYRHPRNACVTKDARPVAIGVKVYGHRATTRVGGGQPGASGYHYPVAKASPPRVSGFP